MVNAEEDEGRRSRLLLPILFAPGFMVILDVFVINVTAPLLRKDLGAGDSAIQLVVVAYVLSFAIALISGGRLGDVVGRRRMLQLGIGGFVVASALCAAATSPAMLIGFRVLQGLAAAAMLPQMLSIIQVEYAPGRRQRAFAYQNIAQALASTSGQLIGGCLIAFNPLDLGWRAVFLINIPVGVVVLVVSGFIVPESRSATARRLDLWGVVLASLALALLLLPAIEGRELGWPPWVFAAMAASVPVGLLFVRSQRRLAARGGAPLVPPRLFASRGFRMAIVSIVVMFFYFSFFLWFSIFLQEGLGLSALDSGIVYTPMALTSAAVSLAVPHLPGRFQDQLPPLGAFATGCAFALVALVAGQTTSLTPAMVFCTLPVGASLGLLVPTLMRLVLHTVPTDEAGSAAGVVSTAQQVGNAVGVALIGTIFFAVLNGEGGAGAYASAFAASTATQALFAFAAAALLFRLRNQTRAHEAAIGAASPSAPF